MTATIRVVVLLLVASIIQIIFSTQVVGAIKVDCYPIAGATKEKCEALGCYWSPVGTSQRYHDATLGFEPESSSLTEGAQRDKPRVDEPWCYHPDGYMGYKITAKSDDNTQIKLTRQRPSFLGVDDIKNLKLTSRTYNSGQLVRITIEDADAQRFVPELPKLNFVQDSSTSNPKANSDFIIELKNFPVGNKGQQQQQQQMLQVRRASTGAILFLTDLGKLIFTNKFIQLNSQLSSPFVYGLGEHFDTFLKWANEFKVYSFWNSDTLTRPGGTRSYGGFPFHINLDSINQTYAYGIYLRNSNAMDVVLQNDLSITYRPIGGVLDFFIMRGPTPLDVSRQFQHLVGLPELPARWGYGFHLCRYNYNSLARTREISERTRNAGIPFDVQWNDVDSLERFNDFTYNLKEYAGLPEFVDELHARNMHYIPLVDPGISQEANYYPYELGTKMDIWIKNATGQTLVGRVWNQSGRTVFPDFSLAAAHKYWAKMFVDYQKLVKFDGAWIDMNDISSFADGSLDGCPWDSELEKSPYLPGGYNLQTHSICLSARQLLGTQYDMHNLYSSYEAIATKSALAAARPGRRSVIISRSTHPGQGAYSGHWSGDVYANWDYLRWSIPSLLEHSMYGFTMVGSDICGFAGNTTPELCARWSTLGAFYTFSRNHNDDRSIDQDPVALGPDVVSANKNALTKRYALLPYLYTLVYRAHKNGDPIARSIMFEFFDQNDKQALRVESQFMWGGAIMISPIVTENTFEKATYLPAGRWYETDILPESSSFNVSQVKVPKLIDAPFAMVDWHKTANISLVNMPIFYRGGHIVPVYAQVRATIPDTEKDQPIALEVALCEGGQAKGDLLLDDGESIEEITSFLVMGASNNTLKLDLIRDEYKKEVNFGWVKILGVSEKINKVTVQSDNNVNLPFDQKDHLLMFNLNNLPPVKKGPPMTLSWSI